MLEGVDQTETRGGSNQEMTGLLTCLLEEGAVRMELHRRGMRTLASFFSASKGL